jgi:hypothetical protein
MHAPTDPNDKVGQLIPQMFPNQVMQVQKMPLNTVNSYSKPTTTTTYVFNTMFRDDFFNSESNSCSFTLPKKLKNVMSMNLSALQYPNVASTFSDGKGTNVIYVAEDTTQLQGLVVLPSGNYEVNDFVATLQAIINAQLGSENRFQVAVNPRTNRITVSNTQYTFNMNLIEKVGTSFRWSYTAANVINTPKRTTDFVSSMGYIMGFTKIKYSGLQSYESESVFNTIYQDYVYVELNDFTGSQFESTVGMLPTGTVNKNILAVVPIVSAKLTTNFDSNANFIQKTRTYSAPVNISKVSVRIVGPVGELVDLKHCDYVFCLEITTVFDNVLPYVA